MGFFATYQISAAVKNKQSYTADYPAKVSPLDLVLAWGDLNQSDIDRHIHYSQSGRWYFFRFENGPWTSSLTRKDAGDGSCEIMYVKKVRIS